MGIFPNKFLLNICTCGFVLSSAIYGIGLEAQEKRVQEKKEVKEWKKFTSEESGFAIDFPRPPEHIEQTIDIPKTDLKIIYNTYLSEPSDAVVYVVSVWNYPAELDMSKPEVNLQDGFHGMLQALPGSQVLSMQMGEDGGFKALNFLVKNEDIFFQGKLVLVYNTLYQVFTVYKESEKMEDNYKRFSTSFKLVQPEKRKVNNKNGKNPQMNI